MPKTSNTDQLCEVENDRQASVIADAVSVFDSRTSSLLPKTKSSLEVIIREIQGKNMTIEQSKSLIARNNLLKHDMTWIRNNGICLEKLRPGPSTINGAGRGAFSQVVIKQNEISRDFELLEVVKGTDEEFCEKWGISMEDLQ